MEPQSLTAREVAASVSLIGLDADDEGERRHLWNGTLRDVFPSLAVHYPEGPPPFGSIARMELGAGELLEIETAPADVRHKGVHAGRQSISLLLQREGRSTIWQGSGSCTVSEGDLCFVDEASAFRMVSGDCSRFLVLRLPRAAVLSRQPRLDLIFVTRLAASNAANRFLARTVLDLSKALASLTLFQRRALIGGVIEMLAMAEPASTALSGDWRVREAVAFIEKNLSRPGLTAEHIANALKLSRRRLDEVMKAHLGHSVANYLWQRRLTKAASDLRDDACRELAVSDIGVANGFSSASHFTRTFKARFHASPREWRERGPQSVPVEGPSR